MTKMFVSFFNFVKINLLKYCDYEKNIICAHYYGNDFIVRIV